MNALTKTLATITLATAALAALLLTGCSDGSSSPTESTVGGLTMTHAGVTVDGESVDGQTFPQDHGESTRFEARLRDRDGSPGTGYMVRVRTSRPGGHGHHRQSELRLYDDGTHGDRVAGDGIYCYEDFGGEYGCHGPHAPAGEHHWEFWGEDHHGHESNHWTITTTITGD